VQYPPWQSEGDVHFFAQYVREKQLACGPKWAAQKVWSWQSAVQRPAMSITDGGAQ